MDCSRWQTEVDGHVSRLRTYIRPRGIAQRTLEFRACRPQELEGLKGCYKNQESCSPDRPECFLIPPAGCEHRPDHMSHLVRDRDNDAIGASLGMQCESLGVLPVMFGECATESRASIVYEQG